MNSVLIKLSRVPPFFSKVCVVCVVLKKVDSFWCLFLVEVVTRVLVLNKVYIASFVVLGS